MSDKIRIQAQTGQAIQQLLGSTGFVNELPFGVVLQDSLGRVLDCNESALYILGESRNEIIGRRLDELRGGLIREDGRALSSEEMPPTITLKTGVASRWVVMGTAAVDHAPRWFFTHTTPCTMQDGQMGVISTLTDVTPRVKSRRILKLLNEMSHIMMFASNEAQCLQQMCATLVNTGAYALAWVGVISPDDPERVETVCSAGLSEYLYDGIVSSSASQDSGNGPSGRALRTGLTQIVEDLQHSGDFTHWRSRAEQFDLGACVCIPFELNGRSACVVIYDHNIHRFDPETVAGLEEIVRQAQFGIAHLLSIQAAQLALEEATRANIALQNVEQSLTDSREWYRLILANSSDVVLVVNRSAKIVYANPLNAAAALHPSIAQVGNSLSESFHPEDRASLEQLFERSSQHSGSSPSHVLRVRDVHGSWRFLDVLMTNCLDDPVIGGVIVNARDITESVAAASQLEESQHFLESITDNMVEGMMAVDQAGIVTYANASAGRLLKWNPAEMIGRSAHDTFHHTRRDGSPFPVAECPLRAVWESGESVSVDHDYFVQSTGTMLPVSYNASPLRVGASSGAVYVFEDTTALVVERERVESELDKLNWVGRCRDALDNERFLMYAQPIVDLATMKTVQHELLIRMVDSAGEVILPARFLPSAEEYGLIGEIDRWVIRQALDLAAAGRRVEFNLSAKSVADPSTLTFIGRRLSESKAPPENLVCEITETAFVHEIATAEALVRGLNEMGIRVALDDFGSGYGGFAYLKRLPASYLKIDREFIKDLNHEASSRHVVNAVVNLAHAFGLETIAEGAEDEDTLDNLRQLGVDFVQGFVVARPAPSAQVFASHY